MQPENDLISVIVNAVKKENLIPSLDPFKL